MLVAQGYEGNVKRMPRSSTRMEGILVIWMGLGITRALR
jgi:hypothetical protein